MEVLYKLRIFGVKNILEFRKALNVEIVKTKIQKK
jgi:hypothetical protein